MKLTFESHASSATVAAALKEARRQLEAQRTHYARMVEKGELKGVEAESRMFAQKVVVGIVSEVLTATKEAEDARANFGAEEDYDGPLGD